MTKGNNGTGNIPQRDVWETPQDLWDKLNSQYGFTFDCCADEKNTKCTSWSSNWRKDAFNFNGGLTAWMNPPFSQSFSMFKTFFDVIRKGVCIYRCDNMETKVWQDIILKGADWVFIPKGRISYEGFEGIGSRFPSALIGVGVEPPTCDIEIEGTLLRL